MFSVMGRERSRIGGRDRRCLTVVALVSLAVALGGSLLGPAAASANLEFVKAFGGNEAASDGGPLNGGGDAVAVNERTGDLYVVDVLKERVLRFTARGEFLEAWGWGVGDESHKFERCGPDGEAAFPECGRESLRGEGPGEFNFYNGDGIGVDQATGEVYVESGHQVGEVQVFSESGELRTSFASEAETGLVAFAGPIAVDGAGDAFIDTGSLGGSRVIEYTRKNATEYINSREVLKGVEVEFLKIAANGSLFAASPARIERFDPPNYTAASWEHSLTKPEGVTINPENGEVFVYRASGNTYHEFKPRGTNEVENRAGEAGKEDLFKGQEFEQTATSAVYDPAAEEVGHGRGVFYVSQEINQHGEQPHFELFAPPSVAAPPVVRDGHARSVGTSSAELVATIEDEDLPGQYQFEYGRSPCASGGCVPVATTAIAATHVAQDVSATIGGLEPATTYYFRFTVTTRCNAAKPTEDCVVQDADHTFTTFVNSRGGLPDGRAYELVSPADKDGGEVFPLDTSYTSCATECEPGKRSPRQVAASTPDGSAVSYEGFPFASTGDAVNENEYRSYRTPTGWQTVDLTPATVAAHERGYQVLSDSLDEGVLINGFPLSTEAPSTDDMYLRRSDGSLEPLLTSKTVDFEALENPLRLEYEGASNGLGTIVFGANDPLTAETADAPPAPKVSSGLDVYAWEKGALTLVNVLPGDGEAVADAVLGARYPAELGGYLPPDLSNAVSSDGSRIFWSEKVTGQVYVRLNGVETLEVPDTARFLTASSDGSVVLLGDGKIFNVSETGISPSVDLTEGQGGFQGILGASQTLSRVYFIDTAKLTGEEEGPSHTIARAGADNLYAYSDGETRFVATLLESDNKTNSDGVVSTTGDWSEAPSHRTAQVTPDGNYVAFMSQAKSTKNESGTFEVYEYSWDSDTLVCASCNRTNARPVGESRLSLMHPVQSGISAQPHNLIANGRLFFESFDVLTPGNHAPGVKNVYEYERAGQGSCEEAEGCVELISSGRGTADSNFLAADETGANVFFTTRERLVPEDEDELIDVYDAREGGGFPRVGSPAPCRGEACMPAPLAGTSVAPPTSQGLPVESSTPSPAPSGAHVTGLRVTREHGKLHLVLTASAAGTVRVTGRFTKSVVAKVAAGRRESLTIALTRAGLHALKQHRTVVMTVAVEMGDTHVVRKVGVR